MSGHRARAKAKCVLLSTIVILGFGPAVVLQASSGDSTRFSAEEEYWRECWLIEILADKNEVKEFERLENADSLYDLSSQPEQREWIKKWWKDRDPDWTTERNEWREYIDSLTAIADIRYRQPRSPSEHNPPWDERGQYFLKLGPPDTEERAQKMFDIDPTDNERTNELIKKFTHTDNGDMVQKGRAAADATIWTWFPASGRNRRTVRVQFQLNNTLDWVAVPVVDAGAGPSGGVFLSDIAAGSDAINEAIESPPAEYVADQREPIPLTIERIRFHERGDSTDLWLAYAIPVKGLADCEGGGKLYSTFTIESERQFATADSVPGETVSRRAEGMFRVDPATLRDGSLAMQVQRFTVPNSSYRIGFKIDDLCDSNRGITGKMQVEIVRYLDPAKQKKVSDVMLLAAAPAITGSENGRFTRQLSDYRHELIPLPSHVLQRRTDSLRVYHEIYNLAQGSDGKAKVSLTYRLYRADKFGAEEPITLLERTIITRDSSVGCYQAFPLAEIRKGEYIIGIEALDLRDPANIKLSTTRWTATRFKVK